MIVCPVCGYENEDLQIVCVSCRSFLQGRVDALNLFETLWGLLESPRATFRKIILSRHKNFALVLSMLFGMELVFDVAWMKHLGNSTGSLLTLLAVALAAGPPAGLLGVALLSVMLQYSMRLLGGRATFRNMFAASAYAAFPFVVSLFIVEPLALAIFGVYFFGSNPSPMIIKPAAYVLILGLKGIAALYAVYLLVEGTLSAHGFSTSKTGAVAVGVLIVIAAWIAALQLVNVP